MHMREGEEMNDTNTGGPAFPTQVASYEGMTLRDYFAAKAMQGMIASPNMPNAFDAQPVADKAYVIADAMLKAREA
jgi:hypothetical protein